MPSTEVLLLGELGFNSNCPELRLPQGFLEACFLIYFLSQSFWQLWTVARASRAVPDIVSCSFSESRGRQGIWALLKAHRCWGWGRGMGNGSGARQSLPETLFKALSTYKDQGIVLLRVVILALSFCIPHSWQLISTCWINTGDQMLSLPRSLPWPTE